MSILLSEAGLLLIIAGAVAGFFAGLLGIGGGIVLVPAIFFYLTSIGLPAETAMIMSLATSITIVIATSLSSAYAHFKTKKVAFNLIRRYILVQFFGALLGAYLAETFGGLNLKMFFAIFAIFMSYKFIKKGIEQRKESRTTQVERRYVFLDWLAKHKYLTQPIAFLVGFASSQLGMGGGALNVPFLTIHIRTIHNAVATAACLGITIAIPASIGYIYSGLNSEVLKHELSQIDVGPTFGYVNLIILLIIFPASSLVAPLGAKASHSLPKHILQIVFGLFLLIVGIKMLF